MNILFFTAFQVSSQKGGTERITERVSKELRKQGHRCYSAFAEMIDSSFKLAEFDGCICSVNDNILSKFLLDNEIDVVILQGAFVYFNQIDEARKRTKRNIKIICAYHFSPGAENYMISAYNKLKNFRESRSLKKKIKSLISLLGYPLYRRKTIAKFKQMYRNVYDKSDKVVLLSKNFVNGFCEYGNIRNQQKFVAIPNMLSYDSFLDVPLLKEKKKQVVVVSRLEEIQKRISLVLKIWKKVEMDKDLCDWSLVVVGHGKSERDYHELAKTLNLQRVSFEGRQEPQKYYEKASILMMTSKYEGWGLSLTEAQQFGCVPFAFDTYASLTDIVTDSVNGFVISECDLDMYYNKMKKVMLDDSLRNKIALQAIESSRRFESSVVVEKWQKLIETV